uniref:Undecaprenyl-diphosphatase n=1 Tax=Caldiarchaeum subterraneum TaxID=311458 RepID=A0A7C5U485_CALS0
MDFWEAVLLGVLQGLAEWLPVSSEGLVSLMSKLYYGRSLESALAAAIWLHVGTLFSAVIYLRSDIAKVMTGFRKQGEERRLLLFLVAATASSALTALPIVLFLGELTITDWLFTLVVGLLLLLTGVLPRKALRSIWVERVSEGLVVGLVQGLSIIPGVSRSGVTITTLLLLGASTDQSFRLSYLMSIPVVAGAQILLPLLFDVQVFTIEMLAGAAAAFVTGFLMMKVLLTASAKLDHRVFMIPLGAAISFLGILMAFQ